MDRGPFRAKGLCAVKEYTVVVILNEVRIWVRNFRID